MEQLSIIDNNYDMHCAQNSNEYYFKYFALFYITQQKLANLTHRQCAGNGI